MSVVRYFSPERRLAKAIAVPGGKKIDIAIADAEEQIALASPQTAQKIDEILEAIYHLAAAGADTQLPLLYERVREIAGMAALADLPDLGLAAHTFCEQIDLAISMGALTEKQMQVNLGAMRLLRQPDRFSPAERQGLLDNLLAVLDKANKTAAT